MIESLCIFVVNSVVILVSAAVAFLWILLVATGLTWVMSGVLSFIEEKKETKDLTSD